VVARFSASVQTTPGTHPALHTTGTRSFLGAKWLRHGCAEVKDRLQLYLYSPLCAFIAG